MSPYRFAEPVTHPYRLLISLFLASRIVYFAIALLTPSPAYDSSTTLVLQTYDAEGSLWWDLFTSLAERLTRWDAIYFVKAAERGYQREQEWAFGWGMTRLMNLVGTAILRLSPASLPHPYPFALAGLLISNFSHILSVLVLYNLTHLVYPTSGRSLAFLAAALHVFSPAGIFLAAPYSEALFALLSFGGYYLYVKSAHAYHTGAGGVGHAVLVIGAGGMWMLAGMVRSNGVLNGLVLLNDFLREGLGLMSLTLKKEGEGGRVGFMQRGLRVLVLGVAGFMVGLGLAIPQAIAWREYCMVEGEMREWCIETIPSIYIYVQDKYWNVGFLRYWTPGNIPLFLLAAPMLYILIRSSCSMLLDSQENTLNPEASPAVSSTPTHSKTPSLTSREVTLAKINASLIRTFALPQLTLAILALTSYHVQIINRLSSGYIIWYWWLAQTILYEPEGSERREVGRLAVRWCVAYALVQGVLFAGFLPPA